MRPFLGLTCTHDDDGQPTVRPAYVAALHRAGAVAVALPFVTDEDEAAALLDRLDGLVLSGGFDLDSTLWGEAPHPATLPMHPRRQRSELAFARALLRSELPALGICGGMQTLNVAAGGSLHQHIPDLSAELEHSDPELALRHALITVAGTRAAALFGAELAVNSHHHQAVARLGTGFTASAHAPDGIVEVIEGDSRRFLLGVQWHPERMPDDALQQRLFAALTAAAAGRS